jgi:hypothetical protein
MSSQSESDTPASLGVATAEEWEELSFVQRSLAERAEQRSRHGIDQRTMSDPPDSTPAWSFD